MSFYKALVNTGLYELRLDHGYNCSSYVVDYKKKNNSAKKNIETMTTKSSGSLNI